ncbi:MAG: diaminopimelate decarboxylase [Clostridia bacterium]|nr:diaminopimelate decarboxylase [Clostridia bacterium]
MLSPCLSINKDGHLAIGGMDVPALAREYKTPLYIMDEDYIRANCREYRAAMKKHYGDNFLVCYASKAFCTQYIYRILDDEQMGADVVSGGELYTAHKAGFPMDRIYFHGNNKTEDEIKLGLSLGIRRFVVDNLEELELINELSTKNGKITDISFRIKPGVDAHTHDFIKTGNIDSKFGVALENGEAMEIIEIASKMTGVRVVGLHCHIGSQIFDNEPFEHTAEVMMEFLNCVREKLGITITELNLGGGFGVSYVESDDPKTIDTTVKLFTDALRAKAGKLSFPLPFLVIEPGRSLVGNAGITVYTVGSVKEIKDVRTYVSIDGGMTDNPRFALYQAEYTICAPEKMNEEKSECITLAGRSCESGDLIGKDLMLQKVSRGDLVAVFTTGAYNYSMSSNYNRVPRAPVVMVSKGESKLIVRRETYEDILKNDICE